MGIPVEYVTGIPVLFGTIFIALIAVFTEIRSERTKRLQAETNLREAYTEKTLPQLKIRLDGIALRLGNILDSDNHTVDDKIRTEVWNVRRQMNEIAKIQKAIDFEVDTLNDMRNWSLIVTTAFAAVTGGIVSAVYLVPESSATIEQFGFLLIYVLSGLILAQIVSPYRALIRFEKVLEKKHLKKTKWRD